MKYTNTKLILAPMAGFADSAFRTMSKRWGADEVVSEMISAKAVTFNDKKTFDLAKRCDEETPFRIQVFGSEPDIIGEAVKILREKCHPDGFDINMGCPVGKIVKNGEGSALMKNPTLVEKIVKSAVDGADTLPVSVKIRRGFSEKSVNAVEVALAAEAGGADRIAVHGRTREQLYMPPVNLEIIGEVKRAVKVPVIGNGDITSPEKALEMLEITGCDHLMIGRGALGRPWIFSEIKAALQDTEIPVIPMEKKLYEEIIAHLKLALADKGERRAIPEARAQIAHYIKGIRGAAEVRNKINHAETFEEINEILKTIF